MFKISATTIDEEALKNSFESLSAGALLVFEGLVRDHNEGKEVESLEYEAYSALCIAEASKIFAEARAKFSVIEMKCVHREGHLKLGDTAVWIGVTAKHRDNAYQASRYLIDQIKGRLPIWKKEYYTNAPHEWVDCRECAKHRHKHQSQKETNCSLEL